MKSKCPDGIPYRGIGEGRLHVQISIRNACYLANATVSAVLNQVPERTISIMCRAVKFIGAYIFI